VIKNSINYQKCELVLDKEAFKGSEILRKRLINLNLSQIMIIEKIDDDLKKNENECRMKISLECATCTKKVQFQP
jgi:hypothetical protein